MLARRLKQLQIKVIDAGFQLGIHPSTKITQAGKRILLYHGIDRNGRKDINTRFISQNEFERQIRYFKQHFTIVPLSDFVKGNFSKDRFTIALTFDDGYRNNLDYALPILEKYQVHATFFITAINLLPYSMLWADFLDISILLYKHPVVIGGIQYEQRRLPFRRCANYYSKEGKVLKNTLKEGEQALKSEIYDAFQFNSDSYNILADYWKPLSNNEIRLLDKSPYATIGSHGFFHNNLDRIPYQEACNALSNSKSYLENLLQRSVNSIAYPDGAYTEQILDFAKKIGFSQQFATDFRYEKDTERPELFERMGINPFIHHKHQAYATTKGKY